MNGSFRVVIITDEYLYIVFSLLLITYATHIAEDYLIGGVRVIFLALDADNIGSSFIHCIIKLYIVHNNSKFISRFTKMILWELVSLCTVLPARTPAQN